MSNRLVKEFPRIQNPNEQQVLELKCFNTGRVQLNSPLPPDAVCKLLVNLAIDLIFQSLEPKTQDQIVQPPPGI
jgi:hypothetical protein